MEKVRPWCGQPSDRGRLRNRTESQRPEIACLPYFYAWRGPSANLESRSETCCRRLAANTGRKKSRHKSPSGHHRTSLSGNIFANTARIDNRKKIVKQQYNISSKCPHNMMNFGPVAAESVSLVWGTQANFNWFRVLAALLHGTLVVGVSQTAAFNRGRHLYSAGRPSRWALAHISSLVYFLLICHPRSTINELRHRRYCEKTNSITLSWSQTAPKLVADLLARASSLLAS